MMIKSIFEINYTKDWDKVRRTYPHAAPHPLHLSALGYRGTSSFNIL